MLIPKTTNPVAPADYRPITLLNNDYKIMARIIASRLQPILADLLHPSQYCGVPGRTIFDAVATVRDAIAHAERASIPLCVISLDFKEAFDKISHSYLFSILQRYGFSNGFIDGIKHVCTDVTSVIQVNGNTSRPIPIHSSVRQGCPLSMVLFALCLNPLLHRLDQQLHGMRIQQSQRKTAIVAYADDVTILATSPEDIIAIRDAVHRYEKATGAVLNIQKSQELPVGTWDTNLPVMNIPYTDEIKVLDFNMHKSIERSGKPSWARITNMVRIQARETYGRDLNLAQRIQYVQVYC